MLGHEDAERLRTRTEREADFCAVEVRAGRMNFETALCRVNDAWHYHYPVSGAPMVARRLLKERGIEEVA